VELEHYLAERGKDAQLEEMRAIAEMADVHFIRQGEPRGLGHAVALARQHVGDEPFAVMLPDDIMVESSHVLDEMIAVTARTGRSVIAVKEFPLEEVSAYGCIRPEPVDDRLVKILEIVEKPSPEEAPSNLAVMGRYVFTPDIFRALEDVKPGKGGEIQLTDGVAILLAEQEVYGYRFEEGRYDTGDKLDWLRATVELALARDDLGPPFRAYLSELARREGLG
jgi:UTP--glucose-1-phosphate uridylyltransferase